MKRIAVKIIPNAKKEEIIKEGESHYKVKVRAPAVEGKASYTEQFLKAGFGD